MADLKRKTDLTLRTPGPKKKLGLIVPPPLRMPHEELISELRDSSKNTEPSLTSQTSQTSSPIKPVESLSESTDLITENKAINIIEDETAGPSSSMTSQTSHTNTLSTPSQTSHTQTGESKTALKTAVAPERDFTRVANSISREAVPAGVFKGKSKVLYDCLYRMTRGAILPSRSVRISRPKLMKAAGIGSRVTFDANINHLCLVGLIEVRSITGEHHGNEYTVYIPEEIPSTQTSQTSQTSLTGYAHKLDRLVCLETSQTSHTLSPVISTISPGSKTSLKTTTDDDDGLGILVGILREAATAIIGHDLPKSEVERDRWKELAELLVDELKQAVERAGQISSVPAFLATHLRRRFHAGPSAKKNLSSYPQFEKPPAEPSKEQRLLKMIKDLQMLHVGDPDYQESDLIDDLKFRCQKAGLNWDESMVSLLLNPGIKEGRE